MYLSTSYGLLARQSLAIFDNLMTYKGRMGDNCAFLGYAFLMSTDPLASEDEEGSPVPVAGRFRPGGLRLA